MDTTVSTLLFLNTENGSVNTFEGLFYYDTEMGEWETALNIGNNRDVTYERAEQLVSNDKISMVIAQNSDGVVNSGVVKHMNIIEGKVLVRVKQPHTVAYHDLPDDVKEKVDSVRE